MHWARVRDDRRHRPRNETQDSELLLQLRRRPRPMTVRVIDGVATEIEPTSPPPRFIRARRVCVKAHGLVQKTYNPHRILQPMKRTNPKKGRNGIRASCPISWDEAWTCWPPGSWRCARRACWTIRLPRVAATFGHGGTPASYMGTFPAFWPLRGPIDFQPVGRGVQIACIPKHLYGSSGTGPSPSPPTRPTAATSSPSAPTWTGPAGQKRSPARRRNCCGYKARLQVEPPPVGDRRLLVRMGADRPKTDPRLHVRADPRAGVASTAWTADLPFLRDRTSRPTLVGPDGLYLRDPPARSRSVGSRRRPRRPLRHPGVRPRSKVRFRVAAAVSVDADDARRNSSTWRARPPTRCWSSTCANTAGMGGASATYRRPPSAASPSEYLAARRSAPPSNGGAALPCRPVRSPRQVGEQRLGRLQYCCPHRAGRPGRALRCQAAPWAPPCA